MRTQVNGVQYKGSAPAKEEKKAAQTKREASPEEYKKLKAARRARRKARREGLKKLGFRPNRKMTKDKKTGQSLKEVQV